MKRERMGSGGPRGLQILRSDVKSVRGGFDSHAFPPSAAVCRDFRGLGALRAAGLVAAVVAAVLTGLTGGAGAQTSPGRAPALHDTIIVVPTPPDTSAAGDTTRPGVTGATPSRGTAGLFPKRGRFDAPRWIMMRSLVIPGWGQLANHSWVKATLVAGSETGLIIGITNDYKDLDALQKAVDQARADSSSQNEVAAVNAYNSKLDQVIRREWLLGGLLVFALMDAYVDAHFRDFDIEFKHDPALPGGVPPTSKETRLGLRWHF